ncbi:hypothetical protein [Aliivibrio wodanis]|uniref:hypothetical protein n=1 Tax=Aliivibrio wodanis TaxID=80852 RepID=UPI00406C55D4
MTRFNIKLITRAVIVIGVALLTASCATTSEEPDWFLYQQLTLEQDEYIGYGSGYSYDEAEARAKSQISQSLNSHIRSTISESTNVKGKQVSYESYSTSTISSDSRLSNLIKKKSDKIDGIYYVAYSYFNLPLSKKIKKVLGNKVTCNEELHPYLAKTPLIFEIRNEIKCLPMFSIVQLHNQFYLHLEDRNFPLSKEDRNKLFTHISNSSVHLDLSDKHIDSGEFYHLNVVASKYGYLSLLQQYDDGTTQILEDNRLMKKEEFFTFPNLNQYNGLEAYNNTRAPIRDLTLAVLCPNPIDISGIPTISENFNQTETSFFNYLMAMTKSCEISSVVQVISPE